MNTLSTVVIVSSVSTAVLGILGTVIYCEELVGDSIYM